MSQKFKKGFIYGDVIDNDICDGLIDFFEEFPRGNNRKGSRKNWVGKGPGEVVYADSPGDNNQPKKSLDACISWQNPDPKIRKYVDTALLPLLDSYKKQFPSFEQMSNDVGLLTPEEAKRSMGNNLLSQGVAEREYYGGSHFQVQKYQPKEGFFAWHCEKNLVTPITCDRALVFMTYLNDVPDGGTRFLNQEIITPAVKGLTLLWPTDWTHTHCGQISQKHTKYIATGWFFYKRPLGEFIPYFTKTQ